MINKMNFLKIAVCAFALCLIYFPGIVFAQEDFEYEFIALEEESPAATVEVTPKEELKEMQRQLSELEFYLSELKAQETKALAAVPAGIKNKKFKTVAEKADHYEKISNEYAAKLSNDELSKSDIRISRNLIILAELYATQRTIILLKKDIEAGKQSLRSAESK